MGSVSGAVWTGRPRVAIVADRSLGVAALEFVCLAVTGVENYVAVDASDSTTPETSGVRAALSGPTA